MRMEYEQVLLMGKNFMLEELVLNGSLVEKFLHYGLIKANDQNFTYMSNDMKFYTANGRFYKIIGDSISDDREKGPPKLFSIFLALLAEEQPDMILLWKWELAKYPKMSKKEIPLSSFWHRLLTKGKRIIKKITVFEPISAITKDMLMKIENIAEAEFPQRPRLSNSSVRNRCNSFLKYMAHMDTYLFKDDTNNIPCIGWTKSQPLSPRAREKLKLYHSCFIPLLLFKARVIGMTLMAREIFRDIYEFPDLAFFFFPKDIDYVTFILNSVVNGPWISYVRLLELSSIILNS